MLNFETIRALFTNSALQPGNDSLDNGVLPNIFSGSANTDEIFYIDKDDALESINTRNSYVRNLRVATYHNGEESLITYELTVKGNLYRVESDSGTISFDGDNLHIVSDVYELHKESDGSELYSEIGITSLNDVIALSHTQNSKYSVSNDKKSIFVETADERMQTKSLYEISAETGIVVSEAHYYKGELIIKVTTDSIDVFGADSLPDEYFTVNK